MLIIFVCILLLSVMIFIFYSNKFNMMKSKNKYIVTFAIAVVILISGINYFNLQDNESIINSQAQAVFEQKSSIDYEKDKKPEKQSADKM